MAQILLVTFSALGRAALGLLSDAGHEVIVTETAAAAIDVLASHSPDLMISEIRLGAFNGLYLVLRHQKSHPRMRAILLDRSYDSVLAGEARHYGATYLCEPLNEANFLEQLSRELPKTTSQRRWPRKPPTDELVAYVDEAPARVLDLSYRGLRLEIPQMASVPTQLHIVFAGFGLVIQARSVWAHPASHGSMWCGAELLAPTMAADSEWRHLVDSVQAGA
jgi:DNA-binding response OmpR family regulator